MVDISLLKQIHFMRPEWLLLLIPYITLIYCKYHATIKNDAWINKMPAHLVNALNLKEQGWKTQLPLKFLAVASLLTIIVAAGVTWKKAPSPFEEDKSALVIVLDTSASMLEKDLAPSRLARSKQKIMDLLDTRTGGQTALVVYAGTSHLVIPLTADIEIIKPLLNAVIPKIMPKKGKFAEKALVQINDIASASANPVTVLLVTDGLGSNTAAIFTEAFSKTKHQLLIWGAGNEEKPSSIQYEKDKLTALASSVDGYFRQISIDDADVDYLLGKMQSHMQQNLDDALPWEDASYYLVFIIAGLFLLWFRKGWLIQWCFIGMVSLGAVAPATAVAASSFSAASFYGLWLTKDQQGMIAYKQGDYNEAAELFAAPLWKGLAKYKAEDYKAAHEYFMRIDNNEGLFRAANALARSREYVAARALYRDILKIYPDDEDAAFNLALVHKIIEEINQFSESQKNTENDASKELGDAPVTSEGADEVTTKEMLVAEKLSAEQLLQDDALNELWMQRVQSDPALFLSNKFQIQMYKAEANR